MSVAALTVEIVVVVVAIDVVDDAVVVVEAAADLDVDCEIGIHCVLH